MQWISLLLSNPVAIAALSVVAMSLVVSFFVAVIIQGRELSFWPPKLSAKPTPQSRFSYTSSEVEGLLGDWFEEIPASPDRRYSVGTFRFDKASGTCTYDGINFHTSGEPFCTWRSTVVIVNTGSREVCYIFDSSIRGEMHSTNTGFGVLNLIVGTAGSMSADSGHYIEAKADGRPFTHTMVPLTTVAKQLGIARSSGEGEAFYRRLIQAFEAKRATLSQMFPRTSDPTK